MTLGSVLLQPQVLARMQTLDEEQALADDVVALLHQVMVNPEHTQSVAPAFSHAFSRMGNRLFTRIEPNLTRALSEGRTLIESATGDLDAVAHRVGTIDDFGGALEFVGDMLEGAASLAESISEPALRALSRKISSLLSDTLGLDQSLLKDELREAFRFAREELLSGAAALSASVAALRYSLAALLGRVESELFSHWPSFDLNPDRLAQRLFEALDQLGFEDIRSKIACIVEKLRGALAAASAALALAAPGTFGPRSVGAAQPPKSGDKYLWYASWLYASRRRTLGDFVGWADFLWPGLPDDEVWLTEDKKQLVLRRVFADDVVLHEVTTGTFEWHQAPQFTSASGSEVFTFRASPETMEVLTQLLNALADFGKGITHIVFFATSKKEYAVNIPLWLWNWTNSITGGLGNTPLASLVANRAGQPVFFGWLFAWVPALSVILGSLEGKHTKASGKNIFLQWVTLLASDTISALKVHVGARMVRDVILDILTLINYDGPPTPPSGDDTRPRNFEYSDAFIDAWGVLTDFLFTKYVIPRDDYAYPFKNAKFALWLFLGAPLSGTAAAILGTLTGWAFGRTVDGAQFGKNIGAAAAKSFFLYLFGITQYLGMEGDTDGGKYNTKLKPNGDPHTPERRPFAGYPPQNTSPYKLPWEAGTTKFLGQANQGMFSHMRLDATQRVYAFDFGLDFGDEVLAARGGTVVDFFDWIPDDTDPNDTQVADALTASEAVMGTGWRATSESWNFIAIRHDTQVPEHDKGDNGAVITTYGIYGHGKTGSVRAAFTDRGIAPANIIGSVVQQGHVIMHAGDTGGSFHNHLHFDVSDGFTTNVPDYTIPVVFQETGVAKTLTWYTSSNVKVT